MEDMTGYTLTLLEQLVFDGGASASEACAELLRRERERCAKAVERLGEEDFGDLPALAMGRGATRAAARIIRELQ